MAKGLKVLFVASEVAPLAKTGGMADVCDAIPKYLAEAGHDVDVILPYYRVVKSVASPAETVLKKFTVSIGDAKVSGAVHRLELDRPWRALAVENDQYFDREGLYTDPARGADYADNAERFAFFAKAVLAYLRAAKSKYDVVHAHDWQGGLVVSYLRLFGDQEAKWAAPATVATIHNLGYMGLFPPEAGHVFGLPPEAFHADQCEFHGRWSLLKGGLAHADIISTVSEKYAREIQTPELGFGMEDLLAARADRLVGITHGVDYTEWNPESDPYIVATYSAAQLEGKQECKLDLLATFGIAKEWARKPVIAFIGRLVEQKGLDLIMPIVEDIVAHGYILIFLGEGEKKYETNLRQLQELFPESVGVHLGFSEELAHKIEAGADLLLLPSLYEPCGLSQMYSQKYGTLPVVRATGGLDDTVKGWRKGSRGANGFKFVDKNPEALLKVLADAAMLFEDGTRWRKLVGAAMATDYSWPKIIKKYERLYRKAIRVRKEDGQAQAAPLPDGQS